VPIAATEGVGRAPKIGKESWLKPNAAILRHATQRRNNMKRSSTGFRPFQLVLSVVCVAACAPVAHVSAGDIAWDGGGGTGGYWSNGVNWAGDNVPGTADTARINTNTSSDDPAILDDAQTLMAARLGYGVNNASTFFSIRTGAQLSTTTTANLDGFVVGQVSGGITTLVSQAAGSVSSAADVVIGDAIDISGSNRSTARYELSGGTLTASAILRIGRRVKNGSSATFNQTGGDTTTRELRIGDELATSGTATYRMSGGSLTTTSTSGQVGIVMGASAATGTRALWSVSGDAVINNVSIIEMWESSASTTESVIELKGSRKGSGTDVVGTNLRFSRGQPGSTIRALIDNAAIATPSQMRKVAVANLELYKDGIVDVGFDSGASPASGTWTILTWNAAYNYASPAAMFTLASTVDTDIWSMNFDAVNKKLTVTAHVPAPTVTAIIIR